MWFPVRSIRSASQLQLNVCTHMIAPRWSKFSLMFRTWNTHTLSFVSSLAYFKLKRYSDTREHLQKLEELSKPHPRYVGNASLAHYYLGEIDFTQTKYTDAARHYTQAITYFSTKILGSWAVLSDTPLSVHHLHQTSRSPEEQFKDYGCSAGIQTSHSHSWLQGKQALSSQESGEPLSECKEGMQVP